MPNSSASRTLTASRDSGVPLAAAICATSTVRICSPMLGPAPAECSPESGGKHTANRQAATNGAPSRLRREIPKIPLRISSHHIDDPVRDNDDLFGGHPVQRLLHGFEPQDSRLNIRVRGVPRNRYLRPLLAINLHG